MIADGMGIKLNKIEQTKEPIVSNTHRETQYAAVEPGNKAGIRQRGYGFSNGRLFIEMDQYKSNFCK
jgi:4-hydroxy-tetrahydrodipicolinate reductase